MLYEVITLRLEVRRNNTTAIRLYEKLGYKQIGLLPDYYEDHMEALRYEKLLAPRITSYNVCYTKLLRLKKTSSASMLPSELAELTVITSYSIHYTKLYEAIAEANLPANSAFHELGFVSIP